MPKASRETIQRFNSRMVHMFPNVLDIESSILFCKVCHCNINGNKLFSVQQHFRTFKHKSALELPSEDFSKAPPPAAATTTSLTTPLDYFISNLCTTLLEANLPLKTVDNPGFQMFLTKYTQKDIPNEMTLRAEYMPVLYEKYIQKVQYKVKNKPIWISITESLNGDGHLVAKFAFGVIEEKQKGSIYLLNVGLLERASASSLAAFFNDSLQILWPKKILYENVYLVVTEAIPYMIRAINSLKILYPNMVYVNCLRQAFDRFLEFIRMHFGQVDSFIAICETIFLKCPHRLHLLRSKYHYLKIPSITTSRATSVASAWLSAAIYYCDNFKEINTILEMLSQEDDAECLKHARKLIRNSSLEADFIYLKRNFECVSQAVAQLEPHNDLTLNENLATIEMAKAGIQATNNLKFNNKFEQIINENTGLQELFKINKTLNSCIEPTTTGEAVERSSLFYKFVPVVVAPTEQMFYANNLLENRTKNIDLKSSRREKHESRSNDTELEDHSALWQHQIGGDMPIKRELSPQESTVGSSCGSPTTMIKNEIDLQSC